MTTATRRLALFCLSVIVLAAAVGAYFFAGDGRAARKEGKAESAKAGKGPQAVLITAAVVQPRTLEIYEEVVGTIENVIDPTVGAEVAGRVTRVAGFTGKKVAKGELLAEIDAADFHIQARSDQAEIGRLSSLLEQQERVVERNRKLVSQGFISQNAIDDAIAQRNALRQQLTAARARGEQTGRSVTKSRVVAPIDGEIETQIVAVGDYVKLGDPLFKLVGMQELRVHLLLPEAASTRIKPGLKVVLSPPAAPERLLEARIDEIRPTLGVNNRALNAIVKIRGDGVAVPRRRHGQRAHRDQPARRRADGARAERGAASRRQGGLLDRERHRAPARGGDRHAPGWPAADHQGPERRRDRGGRRRRLPHRRRRGHGARPRGADKGTAAKAKAEKAASGG